MTDDDKYTPNILITVLKERAKYERVLLRITELADRYPGCEIIMFEFEELFDNMLDNKNKLM